MKREENYTLQNNKKRKKNDYKSAKNLNRIDIERLIQFLFSINQRPLNSIY